jgi:hypothetical protein
MVSKNGGCEYEVWYCLAGASFFFFSRCQHGRCNAAFVRAGTRDTYVTPVNVGRATVLPWLSSNLPANSVAVDVWRGRRCGDERAQSVRESEVHLWSVEVDVGSGKERRTTWTVMVEQ